MGKVTGKSCSHSAYRVNEGPAQLFVKEGDYVFITGRREKELDGALDGNR